MPTTLGVRLSVASVAVIGNEDECEAANHYPVIHSALHSKARNPTHSGLTHNADLRRPKAAPAKSAAPSFRVLLDSSPNVRIHAFCRSPSKFASLFPNVDLSSDPRITVFQGGLSDIDTLASCLSGTTSAFLAVAEVKNVPGTTISVDTAHAVVKVLSILDKRDERLPKLIILSSASTEHRFVSSAPKFLLNLLHRALSYVYDDLERAEKYLRIEENERLVTATWIKPSAISHDVQKGHVVSLTDAVEPVSFLDVAAGMVEVANETDGRYDGRSVSVNTAKGTAKIPWEAPMVLLKGLVYHFCPWLYRWGL